MTSTEMHTSFKLLLDKTDSLNYPNFEDIEVDFWLNYSEERFRKQRYTGFAGLGFEEVQKRSDDLRTILKASTITPDPVSADNKPYGRFFDLPADYEFLIEEVVTMEKDCNGVTETIIGEVVPISHDEYSRAVKDPFKKPNKNKVLRLMYQDKSELIASPDVTITGYKIRYIKTPLKISLGVQNSEMPVHTHQEIVDMAVNIVLENIESPRYKTNLNELSKQE